MRVGILFAVLKMRLTLWYQPFEKTEHVALHVRIGVFVYGQAAGGVLDKKNANAVAVVRQMLFDLPRDIDHLFALGRLDGKFLHG